MYTSSLYTMYKIVERCWRFLFYLQNCKFPDYRIPSVVKRKCLHRGVSPSRTPALTFRFLRVTVQSHSALCHSSSEQLLFAHIGQPHRSHLAAESAVINFRHPRHTGRVICDGPRISGRSTSATCHAVKSTLAATYLPTVGSSATWNTAKSEQRCQSGDTKIVFFFLNSTCPDPDFGHVL